MKKYAPGDSNEFKLMIKPGATFKDITNLLAIPNTEYVSLVNGRRIDGVFCFKEEDTLVLFPAVSGG